MQNWYEAPTWKGRLLAEVALMRERFPHLRLVTLAGALQWEGVIEPVPGRRFRIALVYPPRYPYAPPTLWVLTPTIQQGAPHLYADGSICVHRSEWDPMTGTAASVVPLAAAWLVAYLHWRVTGEGF